MLVVFYHHTHPHNLIGINQHFENFRFGPVSWNAFEEDCEIPIDMQFFSGGFVYFDLCLVLHCSISLQFIFLCLFLLLRPGFSFHFCLFSFVVFLFFLLLYFNFFFSFFRNLLRMRKWWAMLSQVLIVELFLILHIPIGFDKLDICCCAALVLSMKHVSFKYIFGLLHCSQVH